MMNLRLMAISGVIGSVAAWLMAHPPSVVDVVMALVAAGAVHYAVCTRRRITSLEKQVELLGGDCKRLKVQVLAEERSGRVLELQYRELSRQLMAEQARQFEQEREIKRLQGELDGARDKISRITKRRPRQPEETQ